MTYRIYFIEPFYYDAHTECRTDKILSCQYSRSLKPYHNYQMYIKREMTLHAQSQASQQYCAVELLCNLLLFQIHHTVDQVVCFME